jgi:hypothetical protein
MHPLPRKLVHSIFAFSPIKNSASDPAASIQYLLRRAALFYNARNLPKADVSRVSVP